MRKLYRKTRSVDMLLDEKGERSTLRIGWSEVVENLDRGRYLALFHFLLLTSVLLQKHKHDKLGY